MPISASPDCPVRRRRARLLAFAAAVAMALCPLMLPLAVPSEAQAEESKAVAYSVDSGGRRTEYTSFSDAIDAGCSDAHPTIVMAKDWMLTDHNWLELDEDKTLTIDMNGHKIDGGGKCSLFKMGEDSSLTLRSSVKTEFTYTGYVAGEETEGLKIETGGLLTGGYAYDNAYFIPGNMLMKSGSTLTLDNVSLAGNDSYLYYGGIYASKNCTVNIKNGSSIEYNYANNGGGIYSDGSGLTVNMDNGHIDNNHASGGGGGIAATESGTRINMQNNSTVDRNSSLSSGGGIDIGNTDFCIEGDGTASVSNNTADTDLWADSDVDAGGICINQKIFSGNEGLIKGLSIKNNTCSGDGGGLYLEQEWTRVVDCEISGNTAGHDGGGVRVSNDDCSIEGCSITGNACDTTGKGYEGGGVFVGYSYDIKLSGACTIRGNTRGKDSDDADDIFLGTISGGGGKAYITGDLAEGSSVGVRTGIEGADRRIAKGFSYPESRDCLFMDLADKYFVTYGTDEGGDAWQRYGTREFDLKVNGGSIGRFANGTIATVNGTSADASKVFKCWSAEGTSGLYPFSDYIKDADLTNPVASFEMPQNDVDLAAEYVTRTKDVSLALAAPCGGSPLSSEGSIAWTSADGASGGVETVAVAWYKKNGDGTLSLATGTAEDGAVYLARVSLSQDLDAGRAFALDIKGSDVKVTWTGAAGADARAASAATVDASSGTLSITSGKYTAGGTTFTGIEGISLTFAAGTSEADFKAALPAKATAIKSDGRTQQFDIDWSTMDFSGLFRNGKLIPSAYGYTVNPSLSGAGDLPANMRSVAVKISVTDTEAEAVAAPVVSPAAGTYEVSADSAKFDADGTAMALTATCGTDGAQIKYTLSSNDGSGWNPVAENADYKTGIDLPVVKGAAVSYRLEIWALKDGTESNHGTLYYTIEDDREVEMVDVTVKYTDTAADGYHGSKKDDVHAVVKGGDVALVATDRPGYSFEKWTDGDGKDLGTDTTLKLAKVSAATTVRAVYNPVVSGFDVEMALPEDDKELAAGASKVEARIGESEAYTDISAYFEREDGEVKIEWSPAADKDGRAEHARSYTATMIATLSGGGVKYVLSPAAEVRINGKSVGNGAYASERDSKVEVCVRCPATGPAEYESVDDLEDVEISFADAWANWKSQDAEHPAWAWGLPDQVSVSYKCGESEMYDISWNSIDGFDPDATEEQELAATGTISFKDKGAYVSHQGNTETVRVKVKVAAPKTVENPIASLKAGTYKGTQKVELSCATEGATIRYTTDGSEPTEESAEYTGAIELARSATIRAKAFRDGMAASKVADFKYTIKHEVRFDAADGSDAVSAWVADGKAAERPKDPARKGYEFAGWYAEGADEAYDFETPVTADLSLYARWSEKRGDGAVGHLVTFDAAGGSAVAAQTVKDGEPVEEPAAPTRSGYDFAGWTLDGSAYDFSTPVKGDLKLVASWKKRESKKEDGGKDDSGSGKEQDGSTDDWKGSTTKTTTVATETTSSGSNLAATGDRTPLIVAALVALGLIAAAAGILAKRRNK